ncbi:MAG TPA: DedA family protein [Pyrinomonadaceae bacterium]|nr:DedA family protein [Chloracidobacterium sp.]MBP9934827.1 DedA family protein [Pyrinomonadaceae bacterium]MBK7803143.1 DedA family protein [Chloracidobacterium sp.]MBK9438210.1 DedA family protein [Chloracidobacterium sp.]MBK9767615.1 DedA family protein [Chloracidobacterium sp.]
MESLTDFFHQIKDFLNPKLLIDWLLGLLGGYVYFGLFFIVFAETGLAVGFFLPGDSLLVVTGLMARTLPDKLNIVLVLIAFFAGSVIGDSTGYWTGRWMGKTLFNRESSLIFKPSRVAKAHAFFEKYGVKTVILARFVPIVRTFAPLVVGAAEMPYAKFLLFSVIGGILWIFSMVLAGYYLGTAIEGAFNIKLEDHIEKVVILVVLLSLLPPMIEVLRHKFGSKPKQDDEGV